MEDSFDPTVITYFNPSKTPFDIIYNNKLFRTIPPNRGMRLPKKPFGVLVEKHLIDRMCNEENKPTSDPFIREKWRKVIVVDEGQDLSGQPLTKEQVYEQTLDKLNSTNESQSIVTCDTCGTKTFNLTEHNMLNHIPTPPDMPKAPIVPTMPERPIIVDGSGIMPMVDVKPAPQTEGQKAAARIIDGITGSQGEGHLLNEVKEDPPVNTPLDVTPKAPPTREQLITYARDTLLMKTDDPKTKELLDTAPLDQLIKELNYGI